MQIDVCKPYELSQRDYEKWREAVAKAAPFGSPFFHPDYVLALAEFRPLVEIAVIHQQGEAVGWLPYERHGSVGRPLGVKLADFQGAIFREGCEIPLDKIVARIGLSACNFDHLLAEQSPDSATFETSDSPWMDLRNGYEAYIAGQRAGNSTLIAQTQRKQRKLNRETERVAFCWHDSDPQALQCLWEWKSAQRLATGTMDILQFDWVRKFLEQIAQREQLGFRGVVSTLRIEDRIAAVHLGMHTATTFHYWFPAYSKEHASASPGLVLLLQVAEECARRGISRIDLGKGDDRYKTAFASDFTRLSTGAVDHNSLRRLLRTSFSSTKQWVKHSPLRTAAKWPVRWWRRWRTQTSMGATS